MASSNASTSIENVSHLFVYGTLGSGFTNIFARALHAQARWLGAARFSGQLYCLGNASFRYPGAIYAAAAATWVQGELWELADPGAAWEMLDAYEGLHDPDPEYRRTIILVTTSSNEQRLAWCYLLQYSPDSSTLIPSGDFSLKTDLD